MKLISLVNARRIVAKYRDEKISTTLAYRLLKFLRATDTEEALFNEKFREIVNQYGQKDDGGNLVYKDGNIALVPTLVDECKKKIAELEETEIDDPGIRIPLGELGELKMSISDLFAMESVLEEEKYGT